MTNTTEQFIWTSNKRSTVHARSLDSNFLDLVSPYNVLIVSYLNVNRLFRDFSMIIGTRIKFQVERNKRMNI